MNTICTQVLSEIKPNDKEKAKLSSLAHSIISKINSIGKKENLPVNAILVGSSARGTWITGQHDLDIFMMFPPDIEREYLEEKGLYIARKIAQDSDKFEERYAEHPYIHAEISGFEIDLVPAFDVNSASNIKSAVDRTPFHNRYVESKIKGFEDEVLLLKQFMKGIGVYGSELKTRGFSGYLVELLIINYGSFLKVIESSCNWKPNMVIDIEKHGNMIHDDPFIMIDPTDPSRNVAAALSLDNFCIFIDKACEFLNSPNISYFKPISYEPINKLEFENIIKKRGTSILVLSFTLPDIVEDVLFPQLHKLEASLKDMFEKHDFVVYNSDVWANENAIVIFELENGELPALKKHHGPYVWSGKHGEKFKSKYKEINTFSNVYIRNGKYIVEIQRKYTKAKELVLSEILNCGLGKHVGLSIKNSFFVFENKEILELKDEKFWKFLRGFFEK